MGARGLPWRSTARALWAALLVLPALGACNATSGTVGGAALTTGLAAGLSVARRSGGDCYVSCLTGTTCNRSTGLCERQPCRGECLPGEKCEESWTGTVRCVGPDGLAVQHHGPAAQATPAAGVSPIWKPVGGANNAAEDAKLPAEGDSLPPR